MLTDADGLTTWVSAAFTAATGYSSEDLRGRAPYSVLQRHCDGPQPLRACYRKNGLPYFARTCIEPQRDAQGLLVGYVWQQTEVTPLVAQQDLAHQVLANDLAESRAVEIELQQMGRAAFEVDAVIDDVVGAFAHATDAADERERTGPRPCPPGDTPFEAAVGRFEVDIGRDQVLCDARMREFWGLTAEDPVPTLRELHARVMAEDRAAVDQAWQQSLRDLRPASLACRVRARGDALHWIQLDWRVRADGDGRRQASGRVRDFSAAVSAAHEAEAQRRELLMAADLARIGLMRVSAASSAVVANAAARHILGLSATGTLQVAEVAARVHPDDRADVEAAFEQGRSAQPAPLEMRVRVRAAQGEWAHIQFRHEIVHGPQGQVLGVMTALIDVTQATQSQLREAQLSESRAMALDLASLGVWEVVEFGQKAVFDANLLRIYGWQGGPAQVPLRRWLQAVHPEDRRGMQRRWLSLQRGRMQRGQADYRIVRDDGSVRWLVVSAARLRRPDGTLAGAFGTTQDVTELVCMRREMDATLRRLQALFDGAINGILLADDEGHYLAANPAACQMLGYTQAELLTLSVRDVVMPEAAPGALWNRFLDDRRQTGRIALRHKSGQAVVTQYMAVSGIQPGVNLSVMEDVSARVQAEQALQQTQQQLRDLAAYQQDQFDELRAQLARDLHDELGQTLGALALEIDLLRESAPGAWQRMRALVGSGVARVRDTSRALRPAALDLGLLPALRALASETTMHGDIDIVTELPPTVPDLAEPQVRALYRIAQEALTNALRHAAPRRVALRLECGPQELTLLIQDDGCGFGPGSADDSGLGLLGMRERAVQVGAVLTIQSAPGVGSTVSVKLQTGTDGGAA